MVQGSRFTVIGYCLLNDDFVHDDVVLVARHFVNQLPRKTIDNFTHKPVQKFGFHTNLNTRETIISNLVEVCTDIHLVNDKATLEEMLTFVRSESWKPEAEEGAHDDCVMSLAIAHYIRPQQKYLVAEAAPKTVKWNESQWEDYRAATPAQRKMLIEKWGTPRR